MSKENPQAIQLCSQKRKQRRALPEEELFSSLVAYARDFNVVEWESVFRNLNPNASKHGSQSGKNL